MSMKLWVSSATPSNSYGLIVVMAETWEEAAAKAQLALDDSGNYVPHQRYAEALFNNLGAMVEVEGDVVIDWDAAQPKRAVI